MQVAAYTPPSGAIRAAPLPPMEVSAEPIVQEPTARPRAVRRAPPAPPAARGPIVVEETIGVAFAETREGEDIVVTGLRPVWARMPSARRLSMAYPIRARERGREGEASLQCIVQTGGRLECERVSATRGFGIAALRVARMLRHAAQFADGSDAVGAQVNLRVVFRLEQEELRASA